MGVAPSGIVSKTNNGDIATYGWGIIAERLDFESRQGKFLSGRFSLPDNLRKK